MIIKAYIICLKSQKSNLTTTCHETCTQWGLTEGESVICWQVVSMKPSWSIYTCTQLKLKDSWYNVHVYSHGNHDPVQLKTFTSTYQLLLDGVGLSTLQVQHHKQRKSPKLLDEKTVCSLAENCVSVCVCAVSYTHLTLPTIYAV